MGQRNWREEKIWRGDMEGFWAKERVGINWRSERLAYGGGNIFLEEIVDW